MFSEMTTHPTMLHAHTPLSMSLCHVNFPGKMQTSLPSQVYMPNTFEGHGVTEFDATHFGPILELRKEKSRDAARSRRGKENYEFYELAKMLPLPAAITSQLDKASIIRLTISCLKLRDFSSHGDPPWQRDGPPPNKAVKGGPPRRRNMQAIAMEIFETHQGTHVLQSLDGFTFALSNDGRFLYISETVSIYLGLSQVEMTGSTIFDYVHVQDHQEMAEQLGLAAPQSGAYPSPPGSGSSEEGVSSSSTPRAVTPTIPERSTRFASIMNPNPSKGYDRCFCIRMKSTLTKRGVHIKSSGYRVVQILAHMRPQIAFTLGRKHPPPLLGLVAVAIALPPPTITELLIDNDMFVTRLSPDLKVTYCEPRINDMMDISADDLTNKNLYDYCHAEDLQKLRKAHIDLLNKGQVLTDYYRLMNKHGGFVWIQTCATVICNAKNAEEQNIIAINYVLSGIEYRSCVMDMNQYKIVTKMEPDQSDQSENENGSEKDEKHNDHERKSPGHGDGEDVQQSHRRKRRHSSSHDDTSTGNHDIMAAEGRSPPDEFDRLLGHAPGGTFNGDVYGDDKYTTDKSKTDINKNSRRKCEKPRKMPRRKSESDGEGHEAALCESNGDAEPINNDSREAAHVRENGLGGATRPGSVHSNITPTSPLDVSGKLRSPAPEDLSINRVSQSPMTTTQSPVSHRTLTPVATVATVASDNWVTTTSGAASDSPADTAVTGSSVLDLEKAMNKHLPSLPNESEHLRAGLVSEYGQSMLGFQHKHNSTIKWIGQHSPSADQLPATNFLKTLYANRESVIRTNIHNPRPQYYTGDMQNSLLTPPGVGGDPYKDSYGAPQISQSKTPPSTMPYSLMGYSSSPISVSMAPNMVESYAMTPPSSVSPQEKYSSPFAAEQMHGDPAMRQYDSPLTMPIKPQAYPLPAHSNSHMSAYERSAAAAAAAAQYPGAGYYSATTGFPSYNHASSPAPAHYRDSTKTGNAW